MSGIRNSTQYGRIRHTVGANSNMRETHIPFIYQSPRIMLGKIANGVHRAEGRGNKAGSGESAALTPAPLPKDGGSPSPKPTKPTKPTKLRSVPAGARRCPARGVEEISDQFSFFPAAEAETTHLPRNSFQSGGTPPMRKKFLTINRRPPPKKLNANGRTQKIGSDTDGPVRPRRTCIPRKRP